MKHEIQPIGSNVKTVGELREVLTNIDDGVSLASLRLVGRDVVEDRLAVAVVDDSGKIIIASHGTVATAFDLGIHEDDPAEMLSFKNSSGEAATSDKSKGDPDPDGLSGKAKPEHTSAATVAPSRSELEAAVASVPEEKEGKADAS